MQTVTGRNMYILYLYIKNFDLIHALMTGVLEKPFSVW